jgi:hypothetical protein
MRKLLLLQMIIMAIVIPVRAARDKDTRRGYKRALGGYLVFCFVYVFLLCNLFFRLP